MNILKAFKQRIVDLIQKHPYTYFYAKILVNRLSIFLPHEESFFAFKHLAKESRGLFLDVGANDGISALSFRRINQTYAIVSIEANPYHERTLARLKRTLPDFDYRLVGASDRHTEQDLYVPFYKHVPFHSASTFHVHLNQNFLQSFSNSVAKHFRLEHVRIKMIPLDEFDFRPNIIKIDVEGHEAQVLQGLEGTIGRCRPFIMVECSRESFVEVNRILRKYDLIAASYSAAKDAFQIVRDDFVFDMNKVEQRNIFYLPSERLSEVPSNWSSTTKRIEELKEKVPRAAP